jgi:hypothetical protein
MLVLPVVVEALVMVAEIWRLQIETCNPNLSLLGLLSDKGLIEAIREIVLAAPPARLRILLQ